MSQTGVSADLITLEVTETVLIDEKSHVEPILNALRAAGIKIALDDFGTGYSSLSYLTQFPFDTIKIDRSFVIGLHQRRQDRILFDHIVHLARDLGKTVVVEGIETEEQEVLAKQAGAHVGQGFLYSAALEIDAAKQFLSDVTDKAAS